MKVRLISESDYQIDFMISCFSDKKIKLPPHQTITFSVGDNVNQLVIEPVSIKLRSSLLERILQMVALMLYYLFYYFLLPFSDDVSLSIHDFIADICFIDRLKIEISSENEDLVEITYHYQNNDVFEQTKIEYKTSYPQIVPSSSRANDKQIRKAFRTDLLRRIFVFIPIILILIPTFVFSLMSSAFSVAVISGVLLLLLLIIVVIICAFWLLSIKRVKADIDAILNLRK